MLHRIPINYKHRVRVFVPVYQVDFDENGDLLSTPTFQYSLHDASSDEEFVRSLKPDYVFELTGDFDATTKSIEFEDND